MQLRGFSTNSTVNLCNLHDKVSRSQRMCIAQYCQHIVSSKTPKVNEIKLRGDFVRLPGQSELTPELLMKFLVTEVAEIMNFETSSNAKKATFKATFKIKSSISEYFLFVLKNWPLGICCLNFCD